MRKQGSLQISHGQTEKNNGAYGIRSHGFHKSDRDDIMRDGRLLDTPDRKGDGHKYCYSFGSERHHDHHCYHHYWRNERGYFQDEFEKEKEPTFNGDLIKLEYAEAWILGMNKLFELHEYTKNMKAKIAIFNLKGKEDIWWEDVKRVREIKMEDLSWNDFKRLFEKM